MITTPLYWGQGLGNQLWSWATLTSIALDKGYSWGIQAPWRFKGKRFLSLDFGYPVLGIAPQQPNRKTPLFVPNYYQELKLINREEGFDISDFDPELVELNDKTKIDGTFQSEKYIIHHKKRIQNALSLPSPIDSCEETCVIHIRGGDFTGHKNLLLGPKYYQEAIKLMRERISGVKFLVITNDTKFAREYLPDLKIFSNYKFAEIYSGPDKKVDHRVALDFALIQNAKHSILANSSFSWWGAWTKRVEGIVIAPKYWARHNCNDGYWSTGGIITQGWEYLDAKGKLSSYSESSDEWENFKTSSEYRKNILTQR